MSSLKVIKLITGDELIGVVEDGRDLPQTEDGFTTENLLFITGALKVTTIYNQETRTHAIYVSDWVPAIADDTLPIDKRQVLTLGAPTPELEAHYLELSILSSLQSEQRSLDYDPQDELDDSDIQKDSKKRALKKKLKDHRFDDDDMQ